MKGIKICLRCKKEFFPIRNNGKTYGKKQFGQIKYCSYSCAAKARGISKEQHKKMILARKMNEGYKSENHWNWQGGITTPKRKKEITKKWVENNREYKNFLNLRRHAKKKKAEGSHIFRDWESLKKQYGYTCPACKKSESEIKLTEDHIIPLSKEGSDYITNIQPLCKSCNSKKHTKIIKYAI